MDRVKMKVVCLLGQKRTLFLRDCRRCGEETWFSDGVYVCDGCASEFIDLSGPERSSVRRADMAYNGEIPDKTEEMGQPDGL